jgi:hypothetical protein
MNMSSSSNRTHTGNRQIVSSPIHNNGDDGTPSTDGTNIPVVLSAQGASVVTVQTPLPDAEEAELQLPQQQHSDLSSSTDADEEEEEGERSTAKKVTRRPFSSVSNGLSNVWKHLGGATPGRRLLPHRPPITSPNTFGNWDSSSSSSSNGDSSNGDSSNGGSSNGNSNSSRSLVATSAVLNAHFVYDPVNKAFLINGDWAYDDVLYMDRDERESYHAMSSACRQREKTIRFEGDFLCNSDAAKDSFTMSLSRPFEDSGEGMIQVYGSGSWWYHTSALSKTEYHFVFNGVIDLDKSRIRIHRFPSKSKVNVDGSSLRKRAASRSAQAVSRAASAGLSAVSKMAIPFRSCVQGRKKSRSDVLPEAQALSPHPHTYSSGVVEYLHGTYNEQNGTFCGLWSYKFSADLGIVPGGRLFNYKISLDKENEIYTVKGLMDGKQVEDEFSFKLVKNDQGAYNIVDDQYNEGCSIYGLMWDIDEGGMFALERVYFSPEVGEEDAVVNTGDFSGSSEEEKEEVEGPEESEIEHAVTAKDDDEEDEDSSGSHTSTDDGGGESDESKGGDEDDDDYGVEVNRDDADSFETGENDSSSRPLSVLELAILKSVHPAMEEMQKIAKEKIMKYGAESGMTSKLLPPDTYTSSLDKVKILFIWSFPVDGLARMLELSKMRVLTLLNPSLDQLFQNLIRELKDNYGCTETEAANLVYDHTLWIDAFPVVADWDWRSKDSFKEFAAEASDISLKMIVGLLDKLEKLEAIYAVGAEGFKMLERIRDNHPKYAKLITQQELTHHGMQLANGFCTGPQIVRYLLQVVFPACSILAGKQVGGVVRASDTEQLLRFVSRVADRSKLSTKELKGVERSIKAAFENNDSVVDAVAAIKDLPEVSELAAVITVMIFGGGGTNRTIQPVVVRYRNRSGDQENPIADQINCIIEWRNGANEDKKGVRDIVRYILKHGWNHAIFKWQHWWEIESNILTIFDIDLEFKYLLQKAIKEESSAVDIVAAIRNMSEVSKLTAVITGMSFVGTSATVTFWLSVKRYCKRANPDNPSSRSFRCNIEWRQGADSGNGGEVKRAMRAILDVWIEHPEFRDMGWSDILRNLSDIFVGHTVNI